MYPTLVQSDDDELKKRILISLRCRGVDALADAEIEVQGGVVMLKGKFASTHDRNLALECCRHVAGVLRIQDETRADREFVAGNTIADLGLTSRIGGYAAFSA